MTLFDALAHAIAILLVVSCVHFCCSVVSWRVRIGISKQGLDRSQNAADVVNWTPHVLKNIKANLTVSVNIGVENFRDKLDLRSFVRVLFCEF